MHQLTPETVRLAIAARTEEISHLLAQAPVDHLAVEELSAANVRDLRQLQGRSAQALIGAAPRNPLRPELAAFFDRFFPKAQTTLTPGGFRAAH